MFEGYTPFQFEVEPDITIRGVQGGTTSGPALLLLHGYPQTYLIWHLVVTDLAKKYTIVALDLRGYGASSKPRGDGNHANYSKRVMARDCARVMGKLGHSRYYVCGHDRGARVTHTLCIDYPERVMKAMLLDISPTLTMYSKTDFEFAKAYYHWFFLIQAAPLPEVAIGGDAVAFFRAFMGRRDGLGVFEPRCLDAYLEVMKEPETIHSTCEDYRAAATVDLDDARADIAAGRQIQCPLRVLWGKKGVIEKSFNAIEDWKEVSATKEVDGHAVDCGHYIPEEAPQELLQNILEFFR
ncbi:hypothetical protein MPDQ_000449 [Monascus purpureus]|uniref:AB hydrolase-1 domain-containing protein n=1 Tax=Monascus purpureus TaxID=5098 RepID=A0A507QS27_MONPU|nr:hypothetical protein MPDQ_000449 [Monascus purpureus]BDD60360.1 hypothetical protein MAP00_005491 [Monascus purpureus]